MNVNDKAIANDMVIWFTKEIAKCDNQALRFECLSRGGYEIETIVDYVKEKLKKQGKAKSARMGNKWYLVRTYGDAA